MILNRSQTDSVEENELNALSRTTPNHSFQRTPSASAELKR